MKEKMSMVFSMCQPDLSRFVSLNRLFYWVLYLMNAPPVLKADEIGYDQVSG